MMAQMIKNLEQDTPEVAGSDPGRVRDIFILFFLFKF